MLQSRPPPPRRPRTPKVPPQIQVLNSTTTSSPGGGEGKRVVIDGVIFQFEQGGKKLTRIGGMSSHLILHQRRLTGYVHRIISYCCTWSFQQLWYPNEEVL